MENKLKYYNLGLIEPKFIPAVWEYSSIILPESPTVFSYTPNETAIKMSGLVRMDEFFDIEKLPADIKMLRINIFHNSTFIVDPNLLVFMLHYPDTEKFKSSDMAIKALTFKTLRDYGIVLEEKNNDVYFLKDDIRKKFFGMMGKPTREGWKVTIFSITFAFNSELANRIYKFDSEKFTKKGSITDISKIVGGISEVAPDIDRDDIRNSVIQKLAERYELPVSEEKLSDNDLYQMNNFADRFDNKDWHLYGK